MGDTLRIRAHKAIPIEQGLKRMSRCERIVSYTRAHKAIPIEQGLKLAIGASCVLGEIPAHKAIPIEQGLKPVAQEMRQCPVIQLIRLFQ